LLPHPDFIDHYVRAQRNMPRILLRGLTDRCRVARVFTTPIQPWALANSPPVHALNNPEGHSLTIGLILNATESLRLVELGPSPEDVI